jgi:hypothetical protein
MFNISRAKSGKLKCQKAPSLLGKQRQSGNIRFTAGQYWLIINRTGTNYVNFVVNLVICGKGVWCSEKFCRSGKFFGPLKWYTDRNFFGDGGGVVVGGAQSENVGYISFRPPKFFLPVRQWPLLSQSDLWDLIEFMIAWLLDSYS